MKLRSATGIVCYVRDISRTVNLYKAQGFIFKKIKPGYGTGYINWFWIDFRQIDQEDTPGFRDEANAAYKWAGQDLYLSFDDVDASYEILFAKRLMPSSKPKTWSWGNR